jgi:hypothetical protein
MIVTLQKILKSRFFGGELVLAGLTALAVGWKFMTLNQDRKSVV